MTAPLSHCGLAKYKDVCLYVCAREGVYAGDSLDWTKDLLDVLAKINFAFLHIEYVKT